MKKIIKVISCCSDCENLHDEGALDEAFCLKSQKIIYLKRLTEQITTLDTSIPDWCELEEYNG